MVSAVCVPWAPLAFTIVIVLYIAAKFMYIRYGNRIYAGIDMLILVSQVAYLRDLFVHRQHLRLCSHPFG